MDVLDLATRRLRATPEERAALRRYLSFRSGGDTLNARLNGFAPVHGALVTVVETLDALLERAELPVRLVVHRGVRDLDEEAPPPMAGNVVEYRGFLSTTLDPEVARRDFAVGPRPAVLEIEAPCGAHALFVPPIGGRAVTYEQEVLFARETRLRHRSRRTEEGLTVVECEVLRW